MVTKAELASHIEQIGRFEAIGVLFQASCRLWDRWVNDGIDLWRPREPGAKGARKEGAAPPRFDRTVISERKLEQVVFPRPDPFRRHLVGCLKEAGLLSPALKLSRRAFDPSTFIGAFTEGTDIRDDDLRYMLRAHIRGARQWSSELNRCFLHFSKVSEALIARHQRRPLPFALLRQSLNERPLRETPAEDQRLMAELFLNISRELRMLVPVEPIGSVRVAPDRLDSEFLLSNLFGVSTGIEGLDQLFGGAGIILPGAVPRSLGRLETEEAKTGTSLERSSCLPGRIVLIRGHFGTGKSLLACHLAASVARKGGIANLTSVEQEAGEYLYMLSSMGLRPRTPGYEIGFDAARRAQLLSHPPSDGSGALVFFHGSPDKIGDLFADIRDCATEMQRYPLRLLVLDSLNSLLDPETTSTGQVLRGELHDALRRINALGVNIVIIEEERALGAKPYMAEENLADAVLELSVREELGYSKRYIKIIKSRFQREQRGEHRLSILPGEGIRVVPSPVAVRARIAQRRTRVTSSSDEGTFGIPELDKIVGMSPRAGDIIVIEGSSGTAKSAIAERFLAARKGNGTSLKFSIGDPLSRSHRSRAEGQDREIQQAFLPRGHSSPGLVFQMLEQEFNLWFRKGPPIDRLVIDDVASFDLDAPFVSSEESFGHILADFVRRQPITTIFVVRSSAWGESNKVRRAIMSNADIHLQLSRPPGEREGRSLLSIAKSPGMVHRPGWFSVHVTPNKVYVSETPALVGINDKGEETSLQLAMFMHADTPRQAEYNYAVAGSLRATPGIDLQLIPQEQICGPHAIHLNTRFSYKQIRIIQMDEYQMPRGAREAPGPLLHEFDERAIVKKDFVKGVWARTESLRRLDTDASDATTAGVPADGVGGRRRSAVPYYCNIGFLVYREGLHDVTAALLASRKQGVPTQEPWRFSTEQQAAWARIEALIAENTLGSNLDWRLIAALNDEFEYRANRNALPKVFLEMALDARRACLFEYPGWSDENYNVLFLEILLWLSAAMTSAVVAESSDWLRQEHAVEAGTLFWRLCRPAFIRSDEAKAAAPESFARNWAAAQDSDVLSWYNIRNVQSNALVWRHWFSSLNQLTLSMPKTQLRQLNVVPLPGEVAVSGDWYMAVLANSALPDVALQLINNLVNPAAELDRLRRGIGLPTRRSFYKDEESANAAVGAALSVLPQLSFRVPKAKIAQLLDRAFRRSDVPDYPNKSVALSAGLRRILEFEATEKANVLDEVRRYVRSTLAAVANQVAFAGRKQ